MSLFIRDTMRSSTGSGVSHQQLPFIRGDSWEATGRASALDRSSTAGADPFGGYTRLGSKNNRVIHAERESISEEHQREIEAFTSSSSGIRRDNIHRTGSAGSDAQVVQLEQELSELSLKEVDLGKYLEEVKQSHARREGEIEAERVDVVARIISCKASLNRLKGPSEVIPPGPACLRFILSDTYNMVASCVIVFNVITITVEELKPSLASDLWLVNHIFLIFYSAELLAKIILLRSGFFLGPLASVWINWLDFVIVFTCIVTWLRPVIANAHRNHPDHADRSNAAYLLSFLRLLRLTRIIKMISIFLNSDLSWTEGPRFQGAIMILLAVNSMLMGFEADLPDCIVWYYAEHLLLVVFSCEIAIRLKRWGCQFFYHREDWFWNWMEFLIVLGAIVDQWVLPCIVFLESLAMDPWARHQDPHGSVGQIVTMLRMARMLRILRLVRLVKHVPPLYTLILGIAEAIQGMFWVLVLCLIVLYAFALIGVKLIGPRGLVVSAEVNHDVSSIFDGVMQSMFVLFVAMNGEFRDLDPIFQALPMSKLCFMLFMVISTWSVLSILTAVISDNMINACYTHRLEREAEELVDKKRRNEVRLAECLTHSTDVRTNGTICQEDLHDILEDDERRLELCEVTGLSALDLEDVFLVLSHNPMEDEQRVVATDAYMHGLQRLNQPVNQRSIMRLEQQMMHLHHAVEKVVDFCQIQSPGASASVNAPALGLRERQAFVRMPSPSGTEKTMQDWPLEEQQQEKVTMRTFVGDTPSKAGSTAASAAKGQAAVVAQIEGLLQQLLNSDADLESRQVHAPAAVASKVATARWRLGMAQMRAGVAAGTGELEEMVHEGGPTASVSQL